ncbi:LysM domain-containing protein [Stagonosporopsis vannaccii]|nr:LysM domain-containing protein [Stagonosporopsis vannaccii]
MNTTNGSSLSTSKSTSTLRPRTRRLISVEDDIYATDDSEGFSSRAGSRIASRTASPANVTSAPSAFFKSAGIQASKATRDTSSTLSGLFGNSWSAVQGLAANVLGNDTASSSSAATRRRAPTHTRRTSTSAPPPKQWGPAGAGSHVGAGTQEEREAMVRAMKRRDLLNATEHLQPDSIGRMKRRNSDDRTSASAPPGENDHGDALIYVHHVKKQDTLAGVCIKYNCEQAVLRKANRMWPNDTILSKKTIVLPVDACGVKGRPVQGPDVLPDEDLLLGEYGNASTKKPETEGLPNGWTTPKQKSTDTSSVVSSNAASEQPWTHDSWVLLPNDKQPTQIARMPRRALGFFPPARRKSVAYSDVASTPRASVDLPRSSTSTNPNTHTTSPSQPTRPRASSNLSSFSAHSRKRSTSGQQQPPKPWLSGPGGVGTLGRNVRSPGPAQDGLNKMFAAHLPNVAPPPGQEYFTPWAPSLLDADGTRSAGSGIVTPSGGDINFQEIGGAIEGWMRKVGSQAQKLLAEPGTPGGRQKVVPGVGATGRGLGDLIELQDDAFEIGDGEEDRGRPREGLVVSQISAERSLSRQSGVSESRARAQQFQSSRQDFNLVLRERGRKGEGGKTD